MRQEDVCVCVFGYIKRKICVKWAKWSQCFYRRRFWYTNSNSIQHTQTHSHTQNSTRFSKTAVLLHDVDEWKMLYQFNVLQCSVNVSDKIRNIYKKKILSNNNNNCKQKKLIFNERNEIQMETRDQYKTPYKSDTQRVFVCLFVVFIVCFSLLSNMVLAHA